MASAAHADRLPDLAARAVAQWLDDLSRQLRAVSRPVPPSSPFPEPAPAPVRTRPEGRPG
jgi:hypothetical protein